MFSFILLLAFFFLNYLLLLTIDCFLQSPLKVSPISSEGIILFLRPLLHFVAPKHNLFLNSIIWTSNWTFDYAFYQKIDLNKSVIEIALEGSHSPKISYS